MITEYAFMGANYFFKYSNQRIWSLTDANTQFRRFSHHRKLTFHTLECVIMVFFRKCWSFFCRRLFSIQHTLQHITTLTYEKSCSSLTHNTHSVTFSQKTNQLHTSLRILCYKHRRFIKVCIVLFEKHCDLSAFVQTLKFIYKPEKLDFSYPDNFDSARGWRIFDATRRNNVKLTDPNELRFITVAPQFITAFINSDALLPWLSRTSVGKRNLLTITSSGSDTELHESPLMLADSFSIFHPSPSSSSSASRERNGTGVRSASRHDEEKRVRELRSDVI